MAKEQVEDTSKPGDVVACPFYRRSQAGESVRQGELLRRVWEWDVDHDQSGKPAMKPRVHPLAIVVSPDCDLIKDYGQRRNDWKVETEFSCVLFCPIEPSDELRKQRADITSRFWEIVRNNKAERYHYLAEVTAEVDASGEGHGPILVDFKSHFTVRTIELYRQLRTSDEDSANIFTTLKTPWREHLQQRFANYIARIGLPVDHFIPENRR